MRQRLRELACVLCGHAWFHFDPRDPDSRLPTHKHCRRCFRNELNL